MMMCGCNSAGSDSPHKRSISVSIPPIGHIVSAIAGDSWSVNTIAPADASPELYDPTISAISGLQKSELFFITGNLTFEQNLLKQNENGDNPKTVDLSRGLKPIDGTHAIASGSDSHTHQYDPHIWNSFRNAAAMALKTGGVIAALDSADSEAVVERARGLALHYMSLDSLCESILTPGTAFLINHPSLSYFARDYGLEQITVGDLNKELTVEALRKTTAEALQRNAKIYFVENISDSVRAESIARQINAKVVVISPASPDFEKNLLKAAYSLASKN